MTLLLSQINGLLFLLFIEVLTVTAAKFKFAGKQKWVKTPRRRLSPVCSNQLLVKLNPDLPCCKVIFIDESKTVIHDASSPDSGPDEFDPVWDSPTVKSDLSSHHTPPLPAAAPASRPGSPTDRLMISSAVLDPDPPAPTWPLVNREEAHLFQHFVEKLARWVTYPPTPISAPSTDTSRTAGLM